MTAPWTPDADERILGLVKQHGNDWATIADQFGGRSPAQLETRWRKVLNPALTLGAFSADEDAVISHFAQTRDQRSWNEITQILPLRTGKQCRDHWENKLNPALNKSEWTPEEDQLLMELHQTLGPQWGEIAKFLNGRSRLNVKNRFNVSIKKRTSLDEEGRAYLEPQHPRGPPKKSSQPPAEPTPPSDSDLVLENPEDFDEYQYLL
jgi:hypothetical protein